MTQKFVLWNTPFSSASYPSVIALVNRDPVDVYAYPFEVIVSPSGLDDYPKYRVLFGEVVAFSAMEEMDFPDSYMYDLERDGNAKSCAYRFIDSPWLRSYESGEYFLFNKDGGNAESLSHYVIFGGDDIVQVVTKNEPSIEVITQPTTLEIRFTI